MSLAPAVGQVLETRREQSKRDPRLFAADGLLGKETLGKKEFTNK